MRTNHEEFETRFREVTSRPKAQTRHSAVKHSNLPSSEFAEVCDPDLFH